VINSVSEATAGVCGSLEYTASFRGSEINDSTTPTKYDSNLRRFSIFTDNRDLEGQQTISVSAHLADYPTVTSTAQESTIEILYVETCDEYAITVPTQTAPEDYLYTGASPGLTFGLTPFVIDPPECGPITAYSCEVTVGRRTDLCDVDDGSTSASFDPSSGQYKFSSTDMVNFEPGAYFFRITGILGSQSETATFTMTLVDPCPEASLYLQPSPFADMTVWRREPISQDWSTDALVVSSTDADCGPLTVVFFNKHSNTDIDQSVFVDDRSGSLANQFTVLATQSVDITNETYEICYRVFYTDYPQIEVE
jgi:hypothetical protein